MHPSEGGHGLLSADLDIIPRIHTYNNGYVPLISLRLHQCATYLAQLVEVAEGVVWPRWDLAGNRRGPALEVETPPSLLHSHSHRVTESARGSDG